MFVLNEKNIGQESKDETIRLFWSDTGTRIIIYVVRSKYANHYDISYILIWLQIGEVLNP